MQKALVIDDSMIDRKIIVQILSSLGIESVEVENGECAFTALKTESDISMIFVDWNMPVLNGIEFTQRLRSDETFKSLPLVMVTGANEMEEVLNALEAGVDEYIMKPLDRFMFEEKLALLGIKINSNHT